MAHAVLYILYAILFTTALLSALLVVVTRNTVYCALALIVTMISLAGIFLLMHAPFVALIQVFVYAGAIMVLFLYVIMLINPRQEYPTEMLVRWRRVIVSLLGAIFILLTTAWLANGFSRVEIGYPLESAQIKEIVGKMLLYYLLPFELTSVLLLIAILGAVVIARRD
jgi:NADH-quinone oxidoreductase subunit J